MLPYHEVLRKLYSINQLSGIKLGLDNMSRLDALLGYPSRKFSSVHVAGTNGKGSVVVKVAKGLQARFQKVGVYTSPHLSSFRERIRINDLLIPEEAIERLLPKIFSLANENSIPATIFEYITSLAFIYFAEEKVDCAVIETGLGGRLDATNIIQPKLSIITSIDFDHTDLLGNTLESIANEKAGITKAHIPVILGPSASFAPVHPEAPIRIIQDPQKGVEEENRAIARAALEFFQVPEFEIRKALTTRPPCRREWIRFQEQDFLLDVSHNPQGLACLFRDLALPRQQLHTVFAISENKDVASCAKIIGDSAEKIHLVNTGHQRCCSPKNLKRVFLNQNVKEERIFVYDSVWEGLQGAQDQAKSSLSTIIVCGTFFMMAHARKFLGIEEPRDPFDLNEASGILRRPSK